MTDPIPTKFEDDEWALIQKMSAKSGIKSRSEIIRRCVRLFAAEVARRGPAWNWVEETSQPLGTHGAERSSGPSTASMLAAAAQEGLARIAFGHEGQFPDSGSEPQSPRKRGQRPPSKSVGPRK